MRAANMLKRLKVTRPLALMSTVLMGSCIAAPAWAQAISLPDTILPREQVNQQEQVNDTPRADWRSGTVGPVVSAPQDPDVLPPFGANLFSGGFRGAWGMVSIRITALNPVTKSQFALGAHLNLTVFCPLMPRVIFLFPALARSTLKAKQPGSGC